MILHINHVQPGRSESTSGVVSTLLSLLEAGEIDPNTLGHLNVHIDWVQYKSNFREPVSIRRVVRDEELLPLADIAVDLRQMQPETIRTALSEALNGAGPDALETPRRTYLESFTPMRSSIIWTFNAVFWKYLPIWEQASGKGYEKALPGGHSDGHNAQAIQAPKGFQGPGSTRSHAPRIRSDGRVVCQGLERTNGYLAPKHAFVCLPAE